MRRTGGGGIPHLRPNRQAKTGYSVRALLEHRSGRIGGRSVMDDAQASLLPNLLVGLVALFLIGIMAATIACGPDQCAAGSEFTASPPENTVLRQGCITMPDGAVLCDETPYSDTKPSN